jgi:hypothetical protein
MSVFRFRVDEVILLHKQRDARLAAARQAFTLHYH